MVTHLDGNVLAGPLSERYGTDRTAEVGSCAECGQSGSLAQSHVYTGAGFVARCANCGAVLLTVVERPGETVVRVHALTGVDLG
ncbi:DUF6510 family protein [Lysobacter korlensis]|uniref:DUF6510 family protein n=1 Tax=Lysobacter korlensis TaxID=553636 RepID=A0ABV6RTC6_9GAMM